jgi:hypothetical protein
VAEAVAVLRSHPVVNSFMVTLCDAAGDRSAVDLAPTACAVRRAAPDRVLHTFNRYQTPSLQPLEIPSDAVTTGLVPGVAIHASSLASQARFSQLVDGPMSRAQVDALPSDHDGSTGSMTTFGAHGAPINQTLLTAPMDPVARTLSVHFGTA